MLPVHASQPAHSEGVYISHVRLKVKRGRILPPGVIPIPECRVSFIKVTKLKTALRIAGLLTYTETNTHWLTPQYTGDINATVGITPPSE